MTAARYMRPMRDGSASLTGPLVPSSAEPIMLDGWVVPPHTGDRRNRDRGSGRRTDAMAQHVVDLVEQFCLYQRKQRGRTDGGVKTYRWNLEQFLTFIRARLGRLARVADLTVASIQA